VRDLGQHDRPYSTPERPHRYILDEIGPFLDPDVTMLDDHESVVIEGEGSVLYGFLKVVALLREVEDAGFLGGLAQERLPSAHSLQSVHKKRRLAGVLRQPREVP
jgi:hypothetical protein